ncbi:MAG: hypothetical protein Ct9H300mP27_08740 [Chloroflexota bacterium]|nr:MAG: hypothetical protein Ct9H300mP27_08740 [Chloroflexota bacterium]
MGTVAVVFRVSRSICCDADFGHRWTRCWWRPRSSRSLSTFSQSMLHNVDDFSLKSAPHLLCLTKATAEVDTARTIVLAAADQLDINPTPDDYTTAKIVRDTAYAAQLSKRATQRVFYISGGSALKKSNPLQRFYRDVTAGCAPCSASLGSTGFILRFFVSNKKISIVY